MGNAIICNVQTGVTVATIPLLYGSLTAPPAMKAGIAFFGEGGTNGTSLLHAVDCVTGTDLWDPGVTVGGSVDCALLVAGLRLYVAASNGFIYGFDISNLSSPTQIFQIDVMSLGSSSTTIAAAILSEDTTEIYLVTSVGVYAASVSGTPAKLWKAAAGTAFVGAVPAMSETMLIASTGTVLYAFDTAATPANGVLPTAWSSAAASGNATVFAPRRTQISRASVSLLSDSSSKAHIAVHPFAAAAPSAVGLTGTLASASSQMLASQPTQPRSVRVGVPSAEVSPRSTRFAPRKIRPMFEGGEHMRIGNSVTLKLSTTDPGQPATDVTLTLKNGSSFNYGQIVALGGDFYGIPNQPISHGLDAAEQADRFQQAFASLGSDPNAALESTNVLDVIQIEIDAVAAAIAAGKQPSTAYLGLASRDYAWNRVTGGLLNGRYGNLQSENFDHFGTDAVTAYQAGHGVALNLAKAAGTQSDATAKTRMLTTAYAMNAFSDHFLSDLFSGGHIRTPRRGLRAEKGAGFISKYLTDALALYMHNEDCKNGVTVVNARGEQWIAYGDRYYLDTIDTDNKTRVDHAVQLSVDEVFAAFAQGTIPASPAQYAALQFTPNLAAAQNYAANWPPNPPAMFVWDGTRVLRRTNLSDTTSHDWTANWSYPSTFRALFALYGAPIGWAEPDLGPAPRAPAIDPNGWNSTTPQFPNWVNGNKVRYAVAFANSGGAVGIGPWSAWTTLAGQFQPTLSNIPIDHLGKATERRIYRQFSNYNITEWVGDIEDNVTTRFADTGPQGYP